MTSPWHNTEFVFAALIVVVLLVTVTFFVSGGALGEFRFVKAPSKAVQPAFRCRAVNSQTL